MSYRPRDLPPGAVLTARANRAVADMLLASLARLTIEDMQDAIARNSEYRTLAAVQWATTAAHRAREFYPELKHED